MSEYTSYYAVASAPLQLIKENLEGAKLTALIANGVLNNPTDKWVVVEVPRLMGFTTPGDYSTFTVIFDPWDTIKSTFPKVIKFFIDEGQDDWSISCSRAGEEKTLQFYRSSPAHSFSKSDREYFAEFFGISFEELADFMKPGLAFAFCAMVKLPYFELEQQDKLLGVIPPGKVIYSSEISD